jgi:uncharacterized membrane protein
MNILGKSVLGAIFLGYLFLGLNYSARQGFWHDEIYTLTFLKGVSVYDFEGSLWSSKDSIYEVSYFKQILTADNFYSNFSKQILHEGHPPLYFILLKFWSYVFGCSELSLRSFSLSCGLLIFLVFFNLFKRKSKRKYTPWFILAILISNPFLFYYFTEARMYALALLFATLSFRYWLDYQCNRKINSPAFLYFCLSSVGLLYTHYYGLFFLSSLALVELLSAGFRRTIFNHSISLFMFLPWGFVIKKQLSFHNVHWTDGIISLSDSAVGYFNGFVELFISPMGAPQFSEKFIIISIFILMLILLLLKKWKITLILSFAILIYGLQVYVFDQIVGHHSILVARYYVFVAIFVYWLIFKMIDNSHIAFSLIISVLYLTISINVIFQLYTLERAPKQMFREVAGFLDSQVDDSSNVLVFEPKGPLMVGVAYYLHKNFSMVTAENADRSPVFKKVYIDEMLGVPYRENKFHREQQGQLELIPFVGVFLYK